MRVPTIMCVCVCVCVCVRVRVLQSLWEDTETRKIQFIYLVSKFNFLINFQVIVGVIEKGLDSCPKELTVSLLL